MQLDRDAIINRLLSLRGSLTQTAPNAAAIPALIDAVLVSLFPQRSPNGQLEKHGLAQKLEEIECLIQKICTPVGSGHCSNVAALACDLINWLPDLQLSLYEDAKAIFQGDPAAQSVDEVIVAYPGFLAISIHRLANWLYRQEIPIVPRMISEHAHQLTGIDIHPGASIGSAFVIDHGTGVVIGETTFIQDNVKIYQGVTLGALSVNKELANKKRHPTIERNVVIYANATILGGDTIIGEGSIIGGNVWITDSVVPGSRVYHRP